MVCWSGLPRHVIRTTYAFLFDQAKTDCNQQARRNNECPRCLLCVARRRQRSRGMASFSGGSDLPCARSNLCDASTARVRRASYTVPGQRNQSGAAIDVRAPRSPGGWRVDDEKQKTWPIIIDIIAVCAREICRATEKQTNAPYTNGGGDKERDLMTGRRE
jgi:hypothetical protein